MSETRVTTIRLPEQLARDVELVARIERLTTSEFIRMAVDAYVRQHIADPDFRQRLARRIEDERTILNRLGGDV
jgi:metal-responsive CopG/Arc/MetJ family transcriptional regulator